MYPLGHSAWLLEPFHPLNCCKKFLIIGASAWTTAVLAFRYIKRVADQPQTHHFPDMTTTTKTELCSIWVHRHITDENPIQIADNIPEDKVQGMIRDLWKVCPLMRLSWTRK